MTIIGRARIVSDAQGATPLSDPTVPDLPQGPRVVRRELLEAREKGARIVRDAERRAAEILEHARHDAAAIETDLRRLALEDAQTQLAAAWIALRAGQARTDRDHAERTLAIARLLAERLLRSQLELDPSRLVPVAREAIAQFWGAQSITGRGCPADLSVLRAHVDALGVPPASLDLVEDPDRAPGALLIRTRIGELDADLALQLDRLVESLRQSSA